MKGSFYSPLLFLAGALANPVEEPPKPPTPPGPPPPEPPPGTSVKPYDTLPPTPTATDPSVAGTQKFQMQFSKKCDPEQKHYIQVAWEESKMLSDAINSWDPLKAYQSVMDLYMGSESAHYRFPITHFVQNQQNLYKGEAYTNANLWIYCEESSHWHKSCIDNEFGAVLAYETESRFFHQWYITFCPAFYTRQRTLTTAIVLAQAGHRDKRIVDSLMESQAGTFFHEMMHMYKLVSDPQVRDGPSDEGFYGPKAIWDLTKDQGTKESYLTSDAYHVSAAAILAMKKFGLSQPPVPREYFTATDSVGVGNATGSHRNALFDLGGTGFLPEGMKSADTFDVNTDYWEVFTPTYTSSISDAPPPTTTSSLQVAPSNMPTTTSGPANT